MIRILMSVMLLFGFVYGQPVNGPWTILQHIGGSSLDNPQIALRNDSTADVFYRDGEFDVHLGVSFLNGASTTVTDTFVTLEPNWSRQLSGVTKADGGWTVICREYSDDANRVVLYSGADTINSLSQLESGDLCDGIHSFCNESYSPSVVSSPSGGFYAGWIHRDVLWDFQNGTWCEEAFPVVQRHSPGNYHEWIGPISSLTMNHVSLIYPVADSLFTLFAPLNQLLSIYHSSEGPYLAGSFENICASNPIEFFVTSGRRFFVISKSGSNDTEQFSARLIELNPTSCTDLILIASEPIASTSHPVLGMAWLTQPSSGIILTRVDTTGAITSPEGVLYWPEPDQQIIAAKLSISDDGRIVVIWTERQFSNPMNTSLKMASVDWNTPLDSDDPHSILRPSSFSLSAFPNPFNSEVRIAYDLSRTQHIDLAVFNVLGQKVETLFAGQRVAGNYSSTWKPETGTGLYFITLKTEDKVKTTKVLYLK